jgi:hypothetical protein
MLWNNKWVANISCWWYFSKTFGIQSSITDFLCMVQNISWHKRLSTWKEPYTQTIFSLLPHVPNSSKFQFFLINSFRKMFSKIHNFRILFSEIDLNIVFKFIFFPIIFQYFEFYFPKSSLFRKTLSKNSNISGIQIAYYFGKHFPKFFYMWS